MAAQEIARIRREYADEARAEVARVTAQIRREVVEEYGHPGGVGREFLSQAEASWATERVDHERKAQLLEESIRARDLRVRDLESRL